MSIVLRPLSHGMVSVLVASKVKGVGVVGPLFDGAIVSRHALPALVRATAINANIALRSRALGIEVQTGIGQSDFLLTLQNRQNMPRGRGSWTRRLSSGAVWARSVISALRCST